MNATHFKAWVLPEVGTDLRFEQRPMPGPHSQGVVVHIESAMVLSYMAKVFDGSIPYALLALPFVPGTNAVGRVEAVGEEVVHVVPGDRVFLSPHLRADEPGLAPAQILIGLTAMGSARFSGAIDGARTLQRTWRDGVFAEYAHWPAACVTPLRNLDRNAPDRLLALAKLVIPYGGLLRAGVEAGDVVAVNGASGFFGSAAVMAALAMGAARVVAIGRRAPELETLAATLGHRVVPAVVAGRDADADRAAIQDAAGGAVDRALDMLGQASSTTSTLATLRALRRGGRLILMGSASAPLPVDFGEMLANDWEIAGNFMYPRWAPARLAALLASGQLDFSPVRIARFPLERLPEAIAAATRMRGLDMTVVDAASRASA